MQLDNTTSNKAHSLAAGDSSTDVYSFMPASTDTDTDADKLKPSPHFTNKHTLHLIQDFLSALKPGDIGPAEVALMMAFLAFKAIDHTVYHSHQKLAEMLGCDARTIRRLEQRLASRKYISLTCRRGLSKVTSVNLENLPTVDPGLPKKPTADADLLVLRYAVALDKYPQFRRKRRKQWYKSQAWNAQKILNRCNGDLGMACAKVSHALRHPVHRKTAVRDLYKLWGRWDSIEKSFAEESAAKGATQQLPDDSVGALIEEDKQ